jgi:Zn-dependent peptidase ImmA (M78 family)
MHLPYLSDQGAKEVADGILEAHNYLKRGKLPVNVEALALRIGYPPSGIPGLHARFDLYGTGYFDPDTGKYDILIDSDHYQREDWSSPFTIAEELGHFLLHKQYLVNIHSIEDRITFEENLPESTRRKFERQAKMVGSALLLPHDLFKPYVLKWAEEHAARIRDDRPYDEADFTSFVAEGLARRLGVSRWICERALHRSLPGPLIHELKGHLEIQYLKDLPENRIKKV